MELYLKCLGNNTDSKEEVFTYTFSFIFIFIFFLYFYKIRVEYNAYNEKIYLGGY